MNFSFFSDHSRQLATATEKAEKLAAEKTEMEQGNYAKQREIGALSAQLEAALYVNTSMLRCGFK
jgi:hypothetical protein